MAIFHYTVKIVGRSKGKSVISASAYLNGDVMKNKETGRISYYTSKKEVVYTSLMMCENAPPEWQIVPEENIKRFQKSVRYKKSADKEAALEKFKITFQKQRLWNEVLKIEIRGLQERSYDEKENYGYNTWYSDAFNSSFFYRLWKISQGFYKCEDGENHKRNKKR